METDLQEKNVIHQPLGVSGLGGWLILVQVGLYITIIMLLVQLFQYSLPALSPETWDLLTSGQSEFYHPMWAFIISFEAIYNIAFLLFSVIIIYYLYRKKVIFPRLMIIFYSVSLLAGVVDMVLVYQIPLARELEDGSTIRDIVQSMITCAIWIPYFLKSERVQNTFLK